VIAEAANPHKKKVDEDWKDQVEREKVQAAAGLSEPGPKSKKEDSKFSIFISTLGMQAMVAMGEMADPSTNYKAVNLDQAKYLIDMLGVIQDKTKGNLTVEEGDLINSVVYQLRMKYLELSEKKGS
jgi:hypothetical protein